MASTNSHAPRLSLHPACRKRVPSSIITSLLHPGPATLAPKPASACLRKLNGGHSPKLPASSSLAPQQEPGQATRLNTDPQEAGRNARRCLLFDLHKETVPYEQAWAWQQAQLARATAPNPLGAFDGEASTPCVDALFILQHNHVYTLGTGSTEGNLLFEPATSPIPVYRTERGGEVTYHGPGQLVLYPILNLRQLERMDLHWYMRTLEEVVIRALEEVSGIEAGRIDGLTGVWVDGAKVAAIGVGAKRWVTYHGVALNVSPDLNPFRHIVPCGISDRPVCSVMSLLDDRSLLEDPYVPSDLEYDGAQSSEELLTEYRYALLSAFEELFGVTLEPAQSRPENLFAADLQLLQTPSKL